MYHQNDFEAVISKRSYDVVLGGGFAFLYCIMLYFTKMVQFALPVFGYQNQGPTCTMVF